MVVWVLFLTIQPGSQSNNVLGTSYQNVEAPLGDSAGQMDKWSTYEAGTSPDAKPKGKRKHDEVSEEQDGSLQPLAKRQE